MDEERRGHLKVAATKARETQEGGVKPPLHMQPQEGGASSAPTNEARSTGRSACATLAGWKPALPGLDVEEPVVGVGGFAGLDGG